MNNYMNVYDLPSIILDTGDVEVEAPGLTELIFYGQKTGKKIHNLINEHFLIVIPG